MVECPKCHGAKKIMALFPCWSEDVPKELRKPYVELPCYFCDGRGKVPIEMRTWAQEGEVLKNRRLRVKLGQRDAAKLLGIGLIVLSDMELGRTQPDLSIYYEPLLKKKNLED